MRFKMREVVKTIEWEKRGRHSLYDWDVLLNGKQWAMVEDEDFNCRPGSFRNGARNMAKKRGLKIQTKIEGGTVFLQATERADNGLV